MDVGAVVVQELHRLHLGVHPRELLAGPEGLVHDGARIEALQLGADERTALSRLDVLELDDPPHRAAMLDVHSVPELIRGDDLGHAAAESIRRASIPSRTWSAVPPPPP